MTTSFVEDVLRNVCTYSQILLNTIRSLTYQNLNTNIVKYNEYYQLKLIY